MNPPTEYLIIYDHSFIMPLTKNPDIFGNTFDKRLT